jgi:hypothetical protein
MCDSEGGEGRQDVKREALIRELRKLAKKQGAIFEVDTEQGKGSHYRVKFGDKRTAIKSGHLTPLYVNLIRKQLGIK